MKISIVTTLYYSAPYVEEFYSRAKAAAEKITDDYEIIFVNDGSPDNSLDMAISLYEKDPKVRVIDLARNFKHHKAQMTGLSYAEGDLVFLIDSDLEEPPELIGRFYDEMKNSGADVVYGIQEKRKGKFFERITGDIFYTLFNVLSWYPIPKNVITARLMSKRYVAALAAHKDQELFMGGLWAITGFKQVGIAVKKANKGKSAYTIARKVSVFVDAVTSFSNKPLVFVFYMGLGIMLVSGTFGFYLVLRKLILNDFSGGWPSLILSIWFLGGLMLFSLGLNGIYLAKVFMETKQRPYTIIRAVYKRSEK